MEDRRLLTVDSGFGDPLFNVSSSGQSVSALESSGAQLNSIEKDNGVIPGQKGNSIRSGEILVGFDGEVVTAYKQRGVQRALEVAAGKVMQFGLTNGSALFLAPALAGHAARLVTHWSLPNTADVGEVVRQLQKQPEIGYAEPNGIVSIQTHGDVPPQDPSFTNPTEWTFGTQEHLPQMNAETAWHVTEGTGVTIAVIDTGVDLDHPDLNGNLKPGTTILKGSTKAGQDDNGHGTHVAGIIAAELNNMSERATEAGGNPAWNGGVVGVAPKAKIMPVKVLGSGGSGSWADIAKGIDYAANNGANIINMSLGGGFSQTVSTAILNAYSKGVLVISAAGNGNAETSGHPASDPYSLSVAAVDKDDVRASFSNYGFSVDVAAPGVKILSTFIDLDTTGPSESGSLTGAYGRISGTSMATPATAGVAALIWSQLPAGTNPTDRVHQVASQLLATADNIDLLNPQFAGKLGAGRIDALAALGSAALGSLVTAPVVTAVAGIGVNATGATVDRLEKGAVISVQFSHVMDVNSIFNVSNYELLYLGSDGQPGNGDTTIPIEMLTTVYDAFPGRGVQFKVNDEGPDGNYQFRVRSPSIGTEGVKSKAGVGLNGDRSNLDPADDFVQQFTLEPRSLPRFQPVEPTGSLVYQSRATETFHSQGDADRYSVTLDGTPQQVLSVQVSSSAASTVTVKKADGTDVPDEDPSPSQFATKPLLAGTYVIEVTGAAGGSYSLDVLLNAVRDTEPNDAIASAQPLDDIFVRLANLANPALTASQAVVMGSLGSYQPDTMLDSFEDNDIREYIEQSNGKDRTSKATVSTAAAHDGTYGLADATNFGSGGWIYRTDSLVNRGDTVSVWVRSATAPTGRGYFGFGSSASGTLSMQMAANTGQLILGRHAGYSNYEDLAVTSQSWQANKWYRFVIDWKSDGNITGMLFDSDGTTLLNKLTANDTTITGGGIAFRSFDSTKHFDSVQKLVANLTPDVYSFHLEPGQSASLVLNHLAGPPPTLKTFTGVDFSESDGSIPKNTSDVPKKYYVQISGGIGTEYTLQVLRNAISDAGSKSRDTAQPITGNVVLGAIRPINVGYYTDYNPGSTRPAAPILAAGYVPKQIKNISTFDLSTIDALTIYEPDNSVISDALLNRLPAIEAWVRSGGKLTIHDRFVSAGAASSNPLIVGRSDILVTRDFTSDIDVIDNSTLITDNPPRTVNDLTLDGGNSSSHGYAVSPRDTINILSFGPNSFAPNPANVSSFSYTLDDGPLNPSTPPGMVYYSTIPLDFYLSGTTAFSTIYAPNTVSYAVSGVPRDEDWYVVTVDAGGATIETQTPEYGSGEFGNNLDPQLQLHDALGNPVEAKLVLADERNERITIPSAGTWYVQVKGGTGIGYAGEYILIYNPPTPSTSPSTVMTSTDAPSGSEPMNATQSTSTDQATPLMLRTHDEYFSRLAPIQDPYSLVTEHSPSARWGLDRDKSASNGKMHYLDLSAKGVVAAVDDALAIELNGKADVYFEELNNALGNGGIGSMIRLKR